MRNHKNLLKLLENLEVLYTDLYLLILEYDTTPKEYIEEWPGPYGSLNLRNVVHDNQYLYFNCGGVHIYRYSFDGKLIQTLSFNAYAMEMINNQLYLLNDKSFYILDLINVSVIQRWELPKKVFVYSLKVDLEKIYFTQRASLNRNYIFLYCKKTGKEIKKFGSLQESQKNGEFNCPAGITIEKQDLYVCDSGNDRIQVVNKENGSFIHQWTTSRPLSLLIDQNLLYVGDTTGIQVFTKDYQCIQTIGSRVLGSGPGEFRYVSGLCIVNDKLYIVDNSNERIQVFG